MRKNRIYSPTGKYHIVMRGVNKQNIFLDSEDKDYFLLLTKKYNKKLKIRTHAYCLMENHVHLMLEDCMQTNISLYMQIIASVYARYFNKKYDRIGHLYQDRFASEIILDKSYFLTVMRYILQNPQKAGICKASEYKWSSYKLYAKYSSLIYRDEILEYLKDINSLYKFVNETTDTECIDISLRPSEKKEKNIEKIKKILNAESPIIPPELPRNILLSKLRQLKKAGLSIRTIARITGIMTWIVQSA